MGYGLRSSIRGEGLVSGRPGRRQRFGGTALFGLYIAGGWLLPGRKRLVPYSIQTLKRLKPELFRQDLIALLDLLKQQKIKPLIERRFPLAEARHDRREPEGGRRRDQSPLAVDSGSDPLGACHQEDLTAGEANHDHLSLSRISFAEGSRGGAALFERQAIQAGVLRSTTQIKGTGFIGLDGTSNQDDASIQAFIDQFFANQVQRSELHPDAWRTIIIHDPADTFKKLSGVAGDKYSYAELDDFSDLIARTLQGAPETSKVERRGVQQQTIYLEFSQNRLAAYGLQPGDLGKLIQARNIIAPGGVFETGQRQITLNPSGQFESPKAIGDIVVTTATAGAPVYLRDLVDISRGYLTSITSFIGGGGPRFWFSISPEPPQTNYAQVIVQVSDKELTPKIIGPLQSALSRRVPGAWITVRQLQTNPVETPVEILISGQADADAKDEAADIQTLRGIATQAIDVLQKSPGIAVMRDDWSPDSPQVKIQIDPDRANVVGISNADVANSTAAAISGASVGLLKEGNNSIPIVAPCLLLDLCSRPQVDQVGNEREPRRDQCGRTNNSGYR